jgi:hypothetical protein
MAKKKTTKKKTAKKAESGSDVNKTQEIKKALTATPEKGPTEIAADLTAKGVDVGPAYVSGVKLKMKDEGGAPKKKGRKGRKKKVARRGRPPKVTPSADITYDQLQKAKAMSRQLGGVEKAKRALAALAELQS